MLCSSCRRSRSNQCRHGSSTRKNNRYHHKKDDNVTQKNATAEQQKEANKKAFEKLIAVAFTHLTETPQYHQVAVNLKIEFIKGNDQYQEDVTGTYKMLNSSLLTDEHRNVL